MRSSPRRWHGLLYVKTCCSPSVGQRRPKEGHPNMVQTGVCDSEKAGYKVAHFFKSV